MGSPKNRSVRTRITSALCALVVIQGLILVFLIAVTGVITKINTNTYETLATLTHNRRNEVQEALNTKRKNLMQTAALLNETFETILANEYPPLGNDIDNERYSALLSAALPLMTEFTKYNDTTGIFLVLDFSSGITDTAKSFRKSLYLRDSSPDISVTSNANLLLEYGPVDIARKQGIAVDYIWSNNMEFSTGYDRDFYFKPIEAALADVNSPDRLQTYGYWTAPFALRRDETKIITYSLPILLSDGRVCGVFGIEMSEESLTKILPSYEIPYDWGFYAMGVDQGDGLYGNGLITSGIYASRFLAGFHEKLDFTSIYAHENASICQVKNPASAHETAIGGYATIQLYDAYSPFFGEEWTLLCLSPKQAVMSNSQSVKNAIIQSISISIILALILSIFVVFYLFEPIRWLSHKVESIDPAKPVRFERKNWREIDDLSAAFEVLSDGIFEAAAKMFTIIELVNMPIGSYEINYQENKVAMSGNLIKIVRQILPGGAAMEIAAGDWNTFLHTLEIQSKNTNEEGITEILYLTGKAWGNQRWFRMRQVSENMRDIGVLIDVTQEIVQQQRLEFERNYDPLTQLYNRHAYGQKAAELLRAQADTVGLMMFADIDDLKFVNDTYGHEAGDDYIKSYAAFLKRFSEIGAVVSRISGDEFVMFMAGYESREEAKAAFDQIYAGIKDIYIHVPGSMLHRVRVSTGLSFYPEDARDIQELYKYADYAMYEAKHTTKGEVRVFDKESYQKNYFVLNMKNILDLFIEEKRLHFAFQPIVDSRTGEIYAYEALMRPMLREMRSPMEILKIARAQSKLNQIENLTLSLIYEWIDANQGKLLGKKVFVNTIPGVIVDGFEQMIHQYRHLADSIVYEVTENEFSDEAFTTKKLALFRSQGSMVAVDDYGSGYSNELSLLLLAPDFIKIDMHIIRYIDKDVDKQQLVQNLIAFASKKQIKTIAEGVETLEELRTVTQLKVDYIQGYWLSRPDFELVDIRSDVKERIKSLI